MYLVSPTQWTWIWASSRRWWGTGKPGMLQSMGSELDMTDQLNNNACHSVVESFIQAWSCSLVLISKSEMRLTSGNLTRDNAYYDFPEPHPYLISGYICWAMSLLAYLALKKTANRTRHPQLSLVSPVQVVEHCHLVYIILVYAILLIAFEESRFVIYLLFRPNLRRTANIEFLWFWFPPISIFLTALVRLLPTGSFLGQ